MYIGDLWLQLWLQNCCKNTEYYSIFQLSLLLLLNNYQYNCNNTISSVRVGLKLNQYNVTAFLYVLVNPVLFNLDNALIDKPRGVTKLLINSILNNLPTNANLCSWDNDLSQLYGNHETMNHVLSDCSTAHNQGHLHGTMTVYQPTSPYSSHLRSAVTWRFIVIHRIGPGSFH